MVPFGWRRGPDRDRLCAVPNRVSFCGVRMNLQAVNRHLPEHSPRKIAYSQCWEDPDTVREALRIGPDDDVLAVTSGGCNVLALLLDQPRSITAVDINPAQNYLLELKRAAVLELSHDNLLSLVGARQSGKRWELYQQVRRRLPISARGYWDLCQDDIGQGVIHIGRFEQYLNLFRRLILPLIHTKRRVEEVLRPKSLEEQRCFYDRVWDTPRWRALFRFFFARRMLSRFARYQGSFQYADLPDVAAHYLERARHAMREIPISNNYFFQYMATGQYKTALPPYLNPLYQKNLRDQAHRICIITTDLKDFLETAPKESFSKFYLSDVFELFSSEQYGSALRQVARVARPGSRLCYYNNLVSRSYSKSLVPFIQNEDELAQSLHRKDRSFVYRSVVVQQVNT